MKKVIKLDMNKLYGFKLTTIDRSFTNPKIGKVAGSIINPKIGKVTKIESIIQPKIGKVI